MLKNPCQDVSFRTGVSWKYFKKEWRPVLDVIHRYVTCKGRLSSAYVYHLQLMAVFLGFPLNFPHYLVKSMTKMSSAIKKGPKNIIRGLFHHGLVRILVERELSKQNRSWDDFLEQNGFLALYHCQFDCPKECARHQEPCQVSASPVRKPMSNPVVCVSPGVRDDNASAPVSSLDSSMPFKHRKKALNLSPVTSKRNENSCEQKGKRLNGKVTGRLTRSMLSKVMLLSLP